MPTGTRQVEEVHEVDVDACLIERSGNYGGMKSFALSGKTNQNSAQVKRGISQF